MEDMQQKEGHRDKDQQSCSAESHSTCSGPWPSHLQQLPLHPDPAFDSSYLHLWNWLQSLFFLHPAHCTKQNAWALSPSCVIRRLLRHHPLPFNRYSKWITTTTTEIATVSLIVLEKMKGDVCEWWRISDLFWATSNKYQSPLLNIWLTYVFVC